MQMPLYIRDRKDPSKKRVHSTPRNKARSTKKRNGSLLFSCAWYYVQRDFRVISMARPRKTRSNEHTNKNRTNATAALLMSPPSFSCARKERKKRLERNGLLLSFSLSLFLAWQQEVARWYKKLAVATEAMRTNCSQRNVTSGLLSKEAST